MRDDCNIDHQIEEHPIVLEILDLIRNLNERVESHDRKLETLLQNELQYKSSRKLKPNYSTLQNAVHYGKIIVARK